MSVYTVSPFIFIKWKRQKEVESHKKTKLFSLVPYTQRDARFEKNK